jgi:hypothetical protein
MGCIHPFPPYFPYLQHLGQLVYDVRVCIILRSILMIPGPQVGGGCLHPSSSPQSLLLDKFRLSDMSDHVGTSMVSRRAG